MKRLVNEKGQALVLVALAMSVLLGFAAFATDIGVMLHERDRAQTAADSAAIAAAENLQFGASAATQAAIKDAALNGFTDGSNGAHVSVSDPPAAGEVENSNFAAKGFVKVTIAQDNPTYFMRVFGRNSMTVAASAVATNQAPGDNCFYILNPSMPYAMDLQGSFHVSAPGCGILIDSNSGDALHFQGSAGSLSAGSVAVVGGDSGQTADSTPPPTLGITGISDPLASEPTQSIPSSGCTGNGNITLTNAITAGCYGNGTGTITLSNVTLGAGLYIFNGPVALNGTVTGPTPTASDPTDGVTLYLANGGLSATTNSTINLSAPLTQSPGNPYNGVVIDDPGTNTIELEMGRASGALSGIIYAPNAYLYIHDSGCDNTCDPSADGVTGSMNLHVDLVVNSFNDQTGNLTITSYSKTFGAGTSPLTTVTLVE